MKFINIALLVLSLSVIYVNALEDNKSINLIQYKDLKNILVDSININLQKSHYFCHFLIFLIPFKFGILVLLWLLMLLHRVSTLFQDGSANEAVLQFAYLLLYLSCQANDHMKLTSFYNPTSLTTIFPPTCPSLNFQNICP